MREVDNKLGALKKAIVLQEEISNRNNVTRILVFDNYDSFTYNLVHLVEKLLHQKVEVHRNDQIALEKIKEFDKIILSPGPGIPSEADCCCPLSVNMPPRSRSWASAGAPGYRGSLRRYTGDLSTVYHGVATPVRILGRNGAPAAKPARNSQRPSFRRLVQRVAR